MSQPVKESDRTSKKNTIPPAKGNLTQEQREKAEVKEVAGRHKGDGQKDHKGRR